MLIAYLTTLPPLEWFLQLVASTIELAAMPGYSAALLTDLPWLMLWLTQR